jgi:hypothetical protein
MFTKYKFSNNSSIKEGALMRSGSPNILHVSGHGKICAKYPEKTKEVRTGSLNTLQAASTSSWSRRPRG